MDAIADKRPRPIPATIGLFFGGLWCWLGAQGLPPIWQMPVGVAGILASLLLIARLWRMKTLAGTGNAMFGRSAYLLAVAFEVAAIVLFTNLAPKYGWQDQLIPVVGIIVGLHFIGLWRATMMTRFLWIAGGMVAISAASAFLPHAWNGLDPRDAACGFGNALVLWFGAFQPPK
ncbi:MAG TPA: hypothetical protein VIM56_12910 [Rhizomicrobium sp.]